MSDNNNNIVTLCDWGLFWNPCSDQEILVGFRDEGGEFDVSPPLDIDPERAFFPTECGWFYLRKGRADLEACRVAFGEYLKTAEEGEENYILLSDLTQHKAQQGNDCVEQAILYPSEGGGFVLLNDDDEGATATVTSLVAAVDLENKLVLTENSKVYAYESLAVVDFDQDMQLNVDLDDGLSPSPPFLTP